MATPSSATVSHWRLGNIAHRFIPSPKGNECATVMLPIDCGTSDIDEKFYLLGPGSHIHQRSRPLFPAYIKLNCNLVKRDGAGEERWAGEDYNPCLFINSSTCFWYIMSHSGEPSRGAFL